MLKDQEGKAGAEGRAGYMYMQVIRDPGGQDLIRSVEVMCDQDHAVVDGSRLIVPGNTVAFAVHNGDISDPYGPGDYGLRTDTSPFFVKLRNLMTRGDAGMTFMVFYISPNVSRFMRLGIEGFLFKVEKYQLTLNAQAACSLTYSICDPKIVLNHLIGAWHSQYTGVVVEDFIRQLIMRHIRTALSAASEHVPIHDMNTDLGEISEEVFRQIRPVLNRYGLEAEVFSVIAVSLPEQEKKKLNALETQRAEGWIRTDTEKENLDRIYNGDVMKRAIAEVLSGNSDRGLAHISDGNKSGTYLLTEIVKGILGGAVLANGIIPGISRIVTEAMDSADSSSDASSGSS